MRKVIVLSLIIVTFFSCKNEEQATNMFTISGEIEGLDTHLFYAHPEKEYTREHWADSIIVKDGKFTYTDSISGFHTMSINTKFSKDSKVLKFTKSGGFFPVKSTSLRFFVYPGADIKVSGEISDFFDAYPSGDDYNNSLAAINKITYPKFNESVNYMVEATFEEDSIKAQSLMDKAGKISEAVMKDQIKHIEENPNSLGALWYLEDMMMRSQIENDKAIELFSNVSPELKDFEIYKTAESRVNGIKATQEGMAVPAVVTNATLDGSQFDIASLRGKYVLIDFWGIWCGPCVAEMPTVKEFQEKHKEKLVVLGINSGDTKEKIQKFVDEHGYDWKQLMSAKGTSEDNFVTRFNVQGFPTKFIVDPEGKIVKRYIGSGEEAFTLLEELLEN